MRLIVLLAVACLMVSCGQPIERVDQIGERISKMHVRDAASGKCVALIIDSFPARPYAYLKLANDADCGR